MMTHLALHCKAKTNRSESGLKGQILLGQDFQGPTIAYEIGTNNLPERHSKYVICNLVTPKVDLFLSDGTAISASTDPLASLKALSVASTSNEHDELIVELQRSKGAPGGSLNGVIVDLQAAEQISSGHLPLYVTTDGVLLGIATRVPTILAQLIGDQ